MAAQSSWQLDTVLRFRLEHHLQQFPACMRCMVRPACLGQRTALPNLCQEPLLSDGNGLVWVCVREACGCCRQVPRKKSTANHHLEERDARAPDIHRFRLHLYFQDLGCHEVESASKIRWLGAQLSTPTEIRNLQSAIPSQQEILWFDVPMQGADGVEILQALHELPRPCAGLAFLHPISGVELQDVQHGALTELHTNEYVLIVFDCIQKLHNIPRQAMLNGTLHALNFTFTLCFHTSRSIPRLI